MNIYSSTIKRAAFLVLLSLSVPLAIALPAGGSLTAIASADSSSCADCGQPPQASCGLDNQMLFIANGRAGNVAVVDVAKMSITDYIPVPAPITNAGAALGQAGASFDKTLQGLGIQAPANLPDVLYRVVEGVVPSADRTSIYAVNSLSFTPNNWTMYQIDTRTHENTRQIALPVSAVGYCGTEYDRNDESSGVLYTSNMEAGPRDYTGITSLPLQLRDPLAGVANALGLDGLLHGVESSVPGLTGGYAQVDLAAGKVTGFISTDYNGDLSSATCGIAWNADGTRAFASQMFEPLVDTIDWNTKEVDGQILPQQPYRSGWGYQQHQATSAKSRSLLIDASADLGISFYDMNLNALVGAIDLSQLVGHHVQVHGVEIAPGNDNILYATVDGAVGGVYVIDITDIHAPKLIGGMEDGLDGWDCGVYAINDKLDYYRAAGKCTRPDLSVNEAASYWASYSDYQASVLSVNFNIYSSGGQADNVVLTGAAATNGVTVQSSFPMNVGDVSPGRGRTATIRFGVPAGVTSFRTSLAATAQSPCGESYSYPQGGGVDVPPAPRA